MSKLLNCKEYLEAVEIALKYVTRNLILSKEEEEKIRKEMKRDICLANRTGEIQSLADEYGFVQYLDQLDSKKKNRKKIMVAGATRMRKNDMYKIFGECNISKKEVDIVDYEMKHFDVRIVNNQYQIILTGPVPHKVKGMGDANNMISYFENSGQTDCRRLGTNCLKITKNTLNQCVQNLDWN